MEKQERDRDKQRVHPNEPEKAVERTGRPEEFTAEEARRSQQTRGERQGSGAAQPVEGRDQKGLKREPEGA